MCVCVGGGGGGAQQLWSKDSVHGERERQQVLLLPKVKGETRRITCKVEVSAGRETGGLFSTRMS